MILSKTASIRVVLPGEALHVNLTVLLFVKAGSWGGGREEVGGGEEDKI